MPELHPLEVRTGRRAGPEQGDHGLRAAKKQISLHSYVPAVVLVHYLPLTLTLARFSRPTNVPRAGYTVGFLSARQCARVTCPRAHARRVPS